MFVAGRHWLMVSALFVVAAAAGTAKADTEVSTSTESCEVNRGSGDQGSLIKPCNFVQDDLAEEYTKVETEDQVEEDSGGGGGGGGGGRLKRKRRSVTPPKEPLEQYFNFTDDKQYFFDLLDGTAPHDKTLFHKASPDGFAESDRTKLLLFDVLKSSYPPWTYRGLYGRGTWQRIPIQNLMKKKNKSFMMLEHSCEQEPVRKDEKECANKEYPSLPSCKSDEQSPMNIDTKRARDSSLKEFEYTNLKDSNGEPVKFPFVMSVPWDGTDLLTVELLGTNPPPAVEKGSISGQKLFLERIHIHYGENETVGSEHTLNQHAYSMELQFIFSRRTDPDGVRTPSDLQYWDLLMEYYTSAGKPYRYKNVHIIALWVKVWPDETFKSSKSEWNDEWNRNANKAFDSLSRAARKFWAIHNTLQQPPSNATPPFKYRGVISGPEEELELGSLFPPQVNDGGKWRDSIYYNYKGGITHPPCFGFVEWDIYDRPLHVKASSWQNFLYIHSEFDDTKFIAGNYRLPRHVYVLELDSKLTKSWSADQEAARQKVITKMAKRDLRRSKPTGSEVDNYDYSEDSEGGASSYLLSNFFPCILCLFLSYFF